MTETRTPSEVNRQRRLDFGMTFLIIFGSLLLLFVAHMTSGCASPGQPPVDDGILIGDGNVTETEKSILEQISGWIAALVKNETETPEPVPTPDPIPDPTPEPDGGDDYYYYVSEGGVKIPRGKLDLHSHDNKFKNVSEKGGQAVVVLDVKLVGALEKVWIAQYPAFDTTNDEWKNGGRAHWRINRELHGGNGTIKALKKDGTMIESEVINLGRPTTFTFHTVDQGSGDEPPPDDSGQDTGEVLHPFEVKFDGVTLELAPGLATDKLALHKAGLGSGGVRANAGSGTTWKIPPEYSNGTAQGQPGPFTYDIDLRGDHAVLSVLYIPRPDGVWPAGITTQGWKVVHLAESYVKMKR